jgi:hypothetical protein
MIALASEFLLFRMAGGESIPFSAEMISVELMGDTAERFDEEFVRHAAHAVFHYFRRELGRQTVSVGEFAEALEKILRGLGTMPAGSATSTPNPASGRISACDLGRLASECGQGCELFFFPSLRDELRRQLQQSPGVLRFRGLRDCVKQLAGARRWTSRCRGIEERILAFLSECAEAESRQGELALVVE